MQGHGTEAHKQRYVARGLFYLLTSVGMTRALGK